MIKAAANKIRTNMEDGGYYAIKGFLYQFDRTMIEVLTNPRKNIAFENQQDINYDDYVVQVKHKEAQDYTPSKIRKPIESLLDMFSMDPNKKFCLYCYFRDMAPQDSQLTIREIDAVIGDNAKARHSDALRKQFLASFIIRFSEDYETQFQQTLGLIKSSFSLGLDEEAVLYHSIFRSKILDRTLLPKTDRHLCLTDLKHFLEDAEITVFHTAYAKYMGAEKYVKLIKKRYFTFPAPNIENFERMFLLECDSGVDQVDLIQIASCIARKFCRTGKSPQPYVIFRNLPGGALKQLKQALYDQRIRFFDGTHFDGDRFRVDELTADYLNNRTFTLKIAPEFQAPVLVQRGNMSEVFQFFVEHPAQLKFPGRHYRIQIDKTEQVIHMIT